MIGPYIPDDIDTFFEPFCGSGAMTIYAAHYRLANKFVLGDTLEPIVSLLREIVENPSATSARYRELWNGQEEGDPEYFNRIRERYNTDRDPVELLYLICRCVKNAIRFNGTGNFTQSVDKRRLGMKPERMDNQIQGMSRLLKGRAQFVAGDWVDTTSNATRNDFVYMDPPYLGTSIGRDKRYHKQLMQDDLVAGLKTLLGRGIRFALSYDGMTGGKEYGPPLPEELNLTRLLLHAGRSSQATLVGRSEDTVESLYLSPGLAEEVDRIIRPDDAVPKTLALFD
jgi:DNA adenine methylase